MDGGYTCSRDIFQLLYAVEPNFDFVFYRFICGNHYGLSESPQKQWCLPGKELQWPCHVRCLLPLPFSASVNQKRRKMHCH